MSSPFRSYGQAGSINSGASSSFPEQPDDGDAFASGIFPLRPINPDEIEPSIPTASDSRDMIQEFVRDPWGEIATMMDNPKLDASGTLVTGNGHIFRGSARSVVYIIEGITCTLPC